MLCLIVALGCDVLHISEDRACLVGAWQIVESATTTPDSSWIDKSPQPGLYMFTDRHFSLMLIPQDTVRAPLIQNATCEERIAAFENFVADAGSYESSDTLIIMKNIIAKLPRAMNGDAGGPYRYWIKGDSLTLSFSGGWAAGGKITYRLVRLN